MPTTLDDVYETRRENLTRLLREPGAKTQLAARLGASQSHITHLLKPPTAASARAIREETARQIEDIMGLAMGQLDRPPLNFDYSKVDTGRPLVVHEQAAAERLTETRNKIAHGMPVSPDLLEEAFKIVIDTLMTQQVRMPSEKAAKMARVVYEQSLATGKVDSALVLSLINLMQ